MPSRCGCADTCSCLVTSGSGTSVGGIGTVDDPYVIEIDPVPVSDSIGFGNTATVEFATAGAGTPDSPWSVTANAKVSMRELTDVLATDVPAIGDVPTWVTDHWEFKPPPTVPPGGTLNQVLAKNSAQDGDTKWMTIPAGAASTVTVGPGIGGDGSVALPVSLRTSGVWPLPNYPAGQTGLNGREVYIDSAGQVRTRPDTIYSPTTPKPATDLISTYPVGTTVMTVTAANGAGWPPNGSCTVVTHRRQDGAIGDQFCLLDSNTKSAAWYRSGNASGWGPWVATADPALPACVYAEAGADITITTTAYPVETPTHNRASITNPHPYRRMLVDVVIECWVLMNKAGSACAGYIGPMLISGGGAWATLFTEWRDEVQESGYTFYRSMKLAAKLWVPAGATQVIGVYAHKSATGATMIMRNLDTIVEPLRYE